MNQELERQADLTKFLVGALVVLAGAVAFLLLRHGLPWSDQTRVDDTESEVDALELVKEDAAAAREEAVRERRRAEAEFASFLAVRLREHDARVEIARHALKDQVAAYFEDRKSRVADFAEEALSWRNRWKGLWDSEEHEEIIRSLFAEKVVSSEEMTTTLTRHVSEFLDEVSREEEDLLGDVRTKITDLPALEVEAALDERAFAALIDERVAALASELRESTWTTALGFGIALAPTVATLAGAPITALSGGATGALIVKWLATKVAAIVASLAISQDEVESDALRTLDRLKHVLMDGAPGAWDDYAELEEISRNDPDPELRERASGIMARMRNKGHLGLDEVFELVQDRSRTVKTRVLSEIGGVQ